MEEIREMKSIRPDILAITPIIEGHDEKEHDESLKMEERGIKELFTEFYENRNGMPPRTELVELLGEILGESEWEAADERDKA